MWFPPTRLRIYLELLTFVSGLLFWISTLHLSLEKNQGNIPVQTVDWDRKQTSLKHRPVTSTNTYSSENKPQRSQILLVTHGRSGSTYTSAIISAHPEVFFLFEPLLLYEDDRWPPKLPLYRQNDMKEESLQKVKEMLNCQFTNGSLVERSLTVTTLAQVFQEFSACRKYKETQGADERVCFEMLRIPCQKSHVTLVKTIRIPLPWTLNMIEENPNLKVIYLVRDPRAVILSQMLRLRNRGNLTLEQSLDIFCPRLQEDVQAARELLSRFPKRFKIVRYETGVMSPDHFAKELLDFADLSFTEEVETRVRALNGNSSGFSLMGGPVARGGPIKEMNKWRYKNGRPTVERIDKSCGDVYGAFGYKPLLPTMDLSSQESLLSDSGAGTLFDSESFT
ncbi:carbohydrate sulfotransferase 1 [Aplysia californica]|uniref:Carbohydrate sulfotransferase 1 n=1 Tax=Aplysia californica TaxID=6500 RepID=A0ABM0JQD1_APLCA|nr:carbohydrate sulfotransferase 1 [Aplysia californica]XP_005099076.1 carbohydrate sulfotransferase 1 [Aplysia californica]